MILIVRNIFTKKETSYPLNKVEDFDVVFDLYPWAHDVALRSDSIKDAAFKIAKYIDRSSRVSATLHSGMVKTEKEPEVQQPKEIKLKVGSIDAFAMSINIWAERRKEEDRGIQRDSSFTPDPGRLRDPKLDASPPVTMMDKIKQRIEDENEDR